MPKTQTPEREQSYEDMVFDDWLFQIVDELIITHPNFYEEIIKVAEE